MSIAVVGIRVVAVEGVVDQDILVSTHILHCPAPSLPGHGLCFEADRQEDTAGTVEVDSSGVAPAQNWG